MESLNSVKLITGKNVFSNYPQGITITLLSSLKEIVEPLLVPVLV